jgi:hypothetical protein
MRKLIGSAVAASALTVLLGGGITAHAADLCLDLDGLPFVLHDVGGGKDGKDMNKELAKPNKCKNVSGLFTSGLGFAGLYASGSICTNSDATNVNVIVSFLDGTLTSRFPLPIPTGDGKSNIVTFSGGADSYDIPTAVAVCDPPNTPLY